MSSHRSRFTFAPLAVAALGFALAMPAFAQNTPSDPSNGNNTNVAAPSAPPGAMSNGATSTSGSVTPSSKADRKAARKQARAKKNAELKKLENAGYNPGRNDPNYPNDLQAAQKKAGIGTGASQ